MPNYKAAKAQRQAFDRQLSAGGQGLQAPEPIKNEALIARSRGFRYGVEVALSADPKVKIGTVTRLVANNPASPGVCRVMVKVNGREQSLKPSDVVRYQVQS